MMLIVALAVMSLLLLGFLCRACTGREKTQHGPSLEGTLADRLAAGGITRSQYRFEMETAAAREEVRDPFAVPPERGSAGI